jgi:hypothetical protein
MALLQKEEIEEFGEVEEIEEVNLTIEKSIQRRDVANIA